MPHSNINNSTPQDCHLEDLHRKSPVLHTLKIKD